MLSDDALAARQHRVRVSQSLDHLPPGHIATAASHLTLSTALSGPHSHTSPEDDLVTGPLRGSIGPDLHKQEWSLRMINNGKKLEELLLDEKVSNQEFAKAASATLQTKFPHTDLNQFKFLAKEVRAKYVSNWRACVLGISVYYRTYKRFPDELALSEYFMGTIDADIISKYLADPNTDTVLTELGVTSPNSTGLSEKQLLALSMLSSFSDSRSLSAKLKSIGIKDWEFNNWLGYPKFQTAYRRITEDLLSEVQPVINTSLVQLATGLTSKDGKPDLAAIKYLNEVNGRWDPASRQVLDMRQFMTKVVDILTQELADDPAKLQRIGARLAGAANAPLTLSEGSTVEPAVQ
jgi:hypothetical protein